MPGVVTFKRTNEFIELYNTEEFATCLDKTGFLNLRLIF